MLISNVGDNSVYREDQMEMERWEFAEGKNGGREEEKGAVV